jgi:hypothetical protein
MGRRCALQTLNVGVDKIPTEHVEVEVVLGKNVVSEYREGTKQSVMNICTSS